VHRYASLKSFGFRSLGLQIHAKLAVCVPELHCSYEMPMLRPISVFVCACAVACTTTQETAPARNPEAILQFGPTLNRRNQLRTEWSKVEASDREYCETRVGECEVQVSDTRADLALNYSNPICKAKSNSDEEAICVAENLLKVGDPTPALKYFKADIWCLEKLQGCVARHQRQEADDSRLAQIAQRRREIESSPQGMLWHARVAATSEKVKYVRATLPPDAEGECRQVSDNSDCESTIEHLDAEFDSELSRPPAEYSIKKASKLYEQLTKTAASCYEPELKCLSKSVAKYGETSESRRWLERNFDLLERRQQLIEKAGERAAEPCIESAVASHQADIVQSYRAYVREPVLYFRTRLHRSFGALHKSEIDCLGTPPAPPAVHSGRAPPIVIDGDS